MIKLSISGVIRYLSFAGIEVFGNIFVLLEGKKEPHYFN